MELQDTGQSRQDKTKWQPSRKVGLASGDVITYERKTRNWPTQLTILISVLGLLFGMYQFSSQQAASTAAATRQAKESSQQQVETAQLQATQLAANAQLQATQQAVNATQALDQEDATAFDAYLDRMSDLLLNYHLITAKQGSPVNAIAEARTLTTLHNFDLNHDHPRQLTLVHFLWRAGLVTKPQPVISLNAADLAFVPFKDALLNNINLSGALLNGSTFNNCNLQNAIFYQTNLTAVTFENVNLTGVNMEDAILLRADLSGDDLTKVNLLGANLNGAILTGAIITAKQLKQIASMQGAIMPDGSKHP